MYRQLPNEIWIIIVNTLGLQGYTRDCTNLIRALEFPENLVYKYLVTELCKSREFYNYENGSYEEQMLEFWKRTGIDDGMSSKQVLCNLNSETQMYKTIWSVSVFENNTGQYCVFPYVLFRNIHGLECNKDKYTDSIFRDTRYTPVKIDEKIKAKMNKESILEELDNAKQITINGYEWYDRKNRIVLYKAQGSL